MSSKCRFPNNLQFSANEMEKELAKRIANNQSLFNQAVDASSGLSESLDEGNSILNEFFIGDSSLKSTDDVADTYGLLPYDATKKQEEEFVTGSGLVLLDDVVYIPSPELNIKNTRRLYLSLNANLTKTKKVLNDLSTFVFVYDKLVLDVIPPKDAYTPLDFNDIQTSLNKKYLTYNDYAITRDNSTIVLSRSYLGMDKPMSELSANSYEIIPNVFHYQTIDNSAPAIQKYVKYGFTGNKLNAILDGNDFYITNSSDIESLISDVTLAASKLIDYIDFVSRTWGISPSSQQKSAFTYLIKGVTQLEIDMKNIISLYLFQVSTLQQKETISLLSEKHKDSEIEYLLEQRQDVDGISFDVTDQVFLQKVQKVLNASSFGSTYISNKKVNTSVSKTQKQLLEMYADLYDTKKALNNGVNKNNLLLSRKYLESFIGRYSPAVTDNSISEGAPSSSPSGIITGWADPEKTMGFAVRRKRVAAAFRELLDFYPQSIAGPLSEVISIIVGLFEQAIKAINLAISAAQKTLIALKKKLDAFLSDYLTLIGGGNFNTSLLKCAINWDIAVDPTILDRLYNLLLKMMAGLLSFLNKLKLWISDLLEKILCMPVDLLNSILGVAQVNLPTVCKLPKFELGDKLSTALNSLKSVATFQSIVLEDFGKDILKVRLSVRASAEKLAQFKSSSGCQSEAAANFMNASVLNVGVNFVGR